MAEITIGSAVTVAVLGYAVVFFGLILLMIVIMALGKVMTSRASAQAEAETAVKETAPVHKEPAPGSAGQIKLYDTDPKDAAMIMAIVADSLGKPINELRFLSIREVKE